ncbi:MAG: GNAT family N-acetyltransferase, partial [Gammaproteobacteria bacterium]|nr:GNAT family N-acetyltransferase [Gammaproteobacteria bacterium]
MAILVEPVFNDMPFSLPAHIETSRLIIRLVEENDIPNLFDVNGDDEVTLYLPYETWQTIEDGNNWYERMCSLHATNTVLQFVIVEKESDRVIGSCLLFRLEEASARAEIGYVMGRAYWKKGFTFEALSGLVKYAFEDCSLRRLEAEI